MKDWEKAVEKFLKEWKNKPEVVGVLVCGSYVTGNPSKYSDIDLHIVLKDGTDWRERGNQYVDGFLVEHFVNPPKQIIKYFKEDYESGTQMAIIQFLTGKTLFDDGTIADLQETAKEWYEKPFPQMPKFKVDLNQYGIWDMCDNLQDAYDSKVPHFMHIYHLMLDSLLKMYCLFLGYPVIKYHKAYEILTDESTRKKYLLSEFPDKDFKEAYLKALVEEDSDKCLEVYNELSNYLHKKLGNFDIDGWKLRSPIDV